MIVCSENHMKHAGKKNSFNFGVFCILTMAFGEKYLDLDHLENQQLLYIITVF
jgi:hypothetical protein